MRANKPALKSGIKLCCTSTISQKNDMLSWLPRPTGEQKEIAWLAFRKLWAGGTVGGFLSALMRSVPIDLQQLSVSPNWSYSLDRCMRYGYLLWLISYFCVSHMYRDTARAIPGSVPFDIVQTVCSFAAAFALGFVTPGHGYLYEAPDARLAYVCANGAVIVICAVSLFLFGRRGDWKINLMRSSGALMAAAGMVVASSNIPAPLSWYVLGTSQLGLWLLLVVYGRLRIATLEVPVRAADPNGVPLFNLVKQDAKEPRLW